MRLAMFCAALALVLIPLAAKGQPVSLSIITAVDASESIDEAEQDLQLSGLARGVTDERFLQRVAETDTGAVGFAAFSWSSGGAFSVIVPWTLVRGADDAEAVAAVLANGGWGRSFDNGNLTDIGGAVIYGLTMAEVSPFPTTRSVINVLTDGRSNAGSHPSLARNEAMARGVTVNAVIFGDPNIELLEQYFRDSVIAGVGAFVEPVEEPSDLPEVLERKFLQDMISALGGAV